MSCLGVHFALTIQEVDELRVLPEEARVQCLREVIEPHYFEQNPMWVVESGESWDAMHRVLTDGQLEPDGGHYPLNHAILGGEALCSDFEVDYIMSLKTPAQVTDVALALADVSEEDFRERYLEIDREDYVEALSEEDLAFTWNTFQAVRDFYQRTAAEGRFVLFTADQ